MEVLCTRCPLNQYVSKQGIFTLNTSTGEFLPKASCKICPYGGNCTGVVAPQPNFWRYTHGDDIRFQSCPASYCCKEPPCTQSCREGRHGVLCGKCLVGSSEALFSTRCIPNSQCGSYWIWFLIFAVWLFYTLLLLFQKDIKQKLVSKEGKNIDDATKDTNEKINIEMYEMEEEEQESYSDTGKKSSPSNSSRKCEADELQPQTTKNIEAAEDYKPLKQMRQERMPTNQVETGDNTKFLQILLYYVQDAALFRVQTVSTPSDESTIKAIILGLFQFSIDSLKAFKDVCLISDLDPKLKLVVTACKGPLIIFTFAFLCLIIQILQRLSKKIKNTATLSDLKAKAYVALMLAILFSFQKIATTTFSLLKCVPIADRYVLFIDGEVTCYAPWQFAAFGYAFACVIPFCIVLLLGPHQLITGSITIEQFFCACALPLPYLFYWLIQRIRHIITAHTTDNDSSDLNVTDSVLKVIQGPCRPLKVKWLGNVSWIGVVKSRRLGLVLLATFVTSSVIRVLCMIILCLIAIVHQIYVQPYKDWKANYAASASLLASILIGHVNLIRGAFETAEYIPKGPIVSMVSTLNFLENLLVFWIPAIVVGVVLIVVLTKLGKFVKKKVSKGNTKSLEQNDNTEERLEC